VSRSRSLGSGATIFVIIDNQWRGSCGRVSLGQGAAGAFGETGRAHTEDTIESGPIVLPRNRGRKLDELRFGEASSQPFREFAGNVGRDLGHGDREIQHQALQVVEGFAGLIAA